MSILDQYNPTQPKNFPTGERIALPAGWYGSKREQNETIRDSLLQVVNYNGTRVEKDEETVQHSWLVTSTNGIPGTAFLNIRIHPSWQTPEAFSVVFNKGEAIDGTTEDKVKLWMAALKDWVERRVDEANTPDEQRDAAISERFDKALTTIHINLGQLFDLQRSLGLELDYSGAGADLVGAQFAGTVKEGMSADTADVKSLYIPKRKAS